MHFEVLSLAKGKRRYIMNTTQTFTEEIDREKRSTRTARNDSLAEGVMGGLVIILAIMGLLNIASELLLPVSVVLMGAVFLLEGETISARVSGLLSESGTKLKDEQPRVGVTFEFIAGIAGVVLGFLALLGWHLLVMVPIAAILYGSTLIFNSGLTARLNDLESERSGAPVCLTRIVCETIASASGIEFLLGLSAGILGMIALTGMDAVRTALGAMLVIGIGSFLSGTALIARIAGTRKK